MTTRYYKLPGSNEYVTWDYLHNTLGYSTSATETVGYKSVVNWGTGAGTGYCTDTTDYEAEWFVQGETGWAGLNGLAWGCNVYPSSATDIKVERSGTESNAASMTFDNVEYWLVESEIGDAWWPRSRWEQQGWAIVEEHTYDFILVDSTTGRITYGVETLTEIEFTPTGYFTIDEGNEVVFVEQSPFPVVCIDEGMRTPESIAPDASFDTELPYYASKLYIVTTDDGQDETLYGWEAEEGTPVVALPTVTISDKRLVINSGGNVTIAANGTHDTKVYNDSSELVPSVYDSSKVYAIIRAASAPFFVVTRGGMKCEDVNGTIGVRNVTSSSISVYQAEYAYCEDTSVTVVTVYDGTLVPYNAFKYTAGGTDYYYVLDSVQTDWTDDLSSIGYNASPYIDMLIGMKWNSDETALEAVTDFNYYWSRVITSEDKSVLNTLGLWVDPGFLKFGSLKYPSSGYSLTLIAVYYDMGITEGDVSQFVVNSYSSDGGNVAGLYAPNHYTGTGIMTWKVRITKL